MKEKKPWLWMFWKIFLAALALILVCGAFLQKKNERDYLRQQELNYQVRLDGITDKAEAQVENLHISMTQLTTNRDIFPLLFYSEISSENGNAVTMQLHSIMANNAMVRLALLYLVRQELVFSSGYSITNRVESSSGSMISAYLEQSGAVFEANNKPVHLFQYGGNMIVAYEFPLDGPRRLAVLFYYLDMPALYRSLQEELPGGSLYVYAKDGAPIFASECEYPDEIDWHDLHAAIDEKGQNTWVRDGQTFLYAKSARLGWQFLYCMNPSLLNPPAGERWDIRYSLVLLTVFLGVMGLSWLLVKPVYRLTQRISQHGIAPDAEKYRGWNFLDAAFEELGAQLQVQEHVIRHAGKGMLSYLFYELCQGHAVSYEEAAAVLKNSDKPFLANDYYEVILFSALEGVPVTNRELEAFREELMNLCPEYQDMLLYVLDWTECPVLIVSMSDKLGEEAVLARSADLVRSLKKLLQKPAGYHIRFGVGTLYHSIFDLRFSYREAQWAASMRTRQKKTDEQPEEAFAGPMKGGKELRAAQIMDLIRQEDKQGALQLTNRLLDEAAEGLDAEQLIPRLEAWISELISAAAATGYAGVEMFTENGNYRLEKDVLLSDTPAVILARAQEISAWILDVVDGYRIKASNPYILEAKKYIDNHYMDQELSQSVVAEAIGLSAAYLSKLFTNNLNMRFSAYLNQYRIRKSCELLQSTELSVTEIAGRVGYSSVQSYIRVFRGAMNMSPGQYRVSQRGKE